MANIIELNANEGEMITIHFEASLPLERTLEAIAKDNGVELTDLTKTDRSTITLHFGDGLPMDITQEVYGEVGLSDRLPEWARNARIIMTNITVE